MQVRVKAISRFLGLPAGLLAIIMAVAPPVVWFALSYESLQVHLDMEAETGARLVTGLIEMNPVLWQYDEVRLNHVLKSRETQRIPEQRRIYDSQGQVAESRNGDLAVPVLSRSSPVWDAGKPVGRVEVSRSLRPLLLRAAVLGLLSALISGGALTLFLLYPVSALRKALDSLSEEKERAQVTLQSIADGVMATGTDGRVLLMNRAAESITGWSQAEALGKPLGEVFQLRDAGGKPVSPSDPPSGCHGILQSPQGGMRWIDAAEAPILVGKGNSIGSVMVFRDVSERVRMEEEFLRVRKLESLGILAGGIAHDFNNLLVGVLGNISLAKAMVAPDRREYKRLEEAESASLKAKELANRLLAFSKGGKPNPREIPVEEVVRDAAQLAARGTNVRCEVRPQEGIWGAFADPGQIGQVINNLVINAVQAMAGGGSVRVAMGNVSIGEAEIPHVKAGKYVKVTVADEGAGIPAEILPQVFDPYFTTKEKGNGLGLANCYTIMKGHGGNIFAESPPGNGAVFHLYIPSTGGVFRNAAKPMEKAALSGKGRVLLMDDEETVLNATGEMLAHIGYEPHFARNGEEALAMYAREARGGGAFGLVILDLTVPGGMGGKEAAARILKAHPDARIIVSSGHSNDPVMSDPGKNGFAGAVAKPYGLEELSRALQQARKPG